MKILGIHFQSHDTSVAMVEDGNILYAAANERFSRRKMDREAPLEASANCVSFTKTKPSDIDIVAFVGDPFPFSYIGRFKELSWPLRYTRGEYITWWKKPHLMLIEMLIVSMCHVVFKKRQFIERRRRHIVFFNREELLFKH